MSNDVPPSLPEQGVFFFRQMGKFIDEAVAVRRSLMKPFFGWYDVVGLAAV